MTTHSKSGSRSLGEAFGNLRRRLGLLTEAEARLAYLEDAQSAVDLELRIRELDRPAAASAHHLYGFAARS